MAVVKSIPFLAMTALAACAHPAPRPGMPTRADLERALMPIDLCAGDDSGTCDSWGMPKEIRVTVSRCERLAPRTGKHVVACRVTFRERHYVSSFDRTYTAQCVQLAADPPAPGEALYWSRDLDYYWSGKVVDPEEPCRRVWL